MKLQLCFLSDVGKRKKFTQTIDECRGRECVENEITITINAFETSEKTIQDFFFCLENFSALCVKN